VAVTVSGLGTLVNRIGDYSSANSTLFRFMESSIKADNAVKAVNGCGLTMINNKPLHYKRLGSASGPAMVFVHGLGGTTDFWMPLIKAQGLESTNSLHLFDLEGHGLSPTSPLSNLSIRSFAEDLNGVFEHSELQSGATLVAHSMGCLIAAEFALAFPGKVGKLILLGPPPSPLPEAGSRGSFQRAETVRSQGMAAVVDAVVAGGTSESTKQLKPVVLAAIRLSLLGQDPEGYAKACAALAGSIAHSLDFSRISAKTLLVTGSEDNISPPQLCHNYSAAMPRAIGVKVLSSVGHWHVFEDLDGVVSATSDFLRTE
jgi:pimeloyl-ACP methyl ester carboxylesterase